MKKAHPANSLFQPSFTPWLLAAVPLILLEWAIFKHFYPYASFYGDSYTYIDAASEGVLVSYRQMGYSWFLWLVHSMAVSDTVLVSVQYLLLQSAGCYLFFTLLHFYKPSRGISLLLFFFLLLNPLTLYISNQVSSDALFTALALLWVTELLWLVQRPGWGRFIRQLLLLTVIFFVRYNALYYPFVAAVAFLLSRKRGWFRWAGIAAGCVVVLIAVQLTTEWTKKETGTRIFSGFSGWQMANNALCIYPHIQVDTLDLPSADCRELNRLVAACFAAPPASLAPSDPGAPLGVAPGSVDTWFMWAPESPLKKYMYLRRKRENKDYFREWNKVAVVFSQYGAYLEKKHPLLFSRYYLLPSARTFFCPPLETLKTFNEGVDTVDNVAKNWFHYTSSTTGARYPAVQKRILTPFRWLYLVVNVVALLTFLLFVLFRTLRRCILDRLQDMPRSFPLIVAYLLLNAGFSIFASGSNFRYQLAPFFLLCCFIVLFFSRLLQPSRRWNP